MIMLFKSGAAGSRT